MVHGYLADGNSWEKPEAALLAAGYRMLTYDRRVSAKSSRPSVGYDYDTLAADLGTLLDQLDLRGVKLGNHGHPAGGWRAAHWRGSHAPRSAFRTLRSAATPAGENRA